MHSLTENYLPIPVKLLEHLRDTPLALGLYCLTARLFLIAQTPVPLSRTDLQSYDPTIKAGAAKRALDRLTSEGWLIETPGHKSSYLPSWGRSREGVDRPWQINADYLGCPRHVFTVRLDRRILDTYIGKLI